MKSTPQQSPRELLESLLDGDSVRDMLGPSVALSATPVPRLELDDGNGQTRSLPYASLHYLGFHAESEISMVFSGVRVHLGGINLRPLFDALHAHLVKAVVATRDVRLPSARTTLVDVCALTPWGQNPERPSQEELKSGLGMSRGSLPAPADVARRTGD